MATITRDSNVFNMDAQHIFHIASVEAENRKLAAKNDANEKIIEFLLAQLMETSSAQRLSNAPRSEPIEEAIRAQQTRPDPSAVDLLSDAQVGSDRPEELPSPLGQIHDNDVLNKYWDVLTPLSAQNALNSDLQFSSANAVSAHPAFQASANSHTDPAVHQQHIATTSAAHDSKSFVTSKPSTSFRNSVEAPPFQPIAWSLESMHSTNTKPFTNHKSSGLTIASENRSDIRSELMYQPSPNDKDTNRTVIIRGFPSTGRVSDLLSQIHTGIVYSLTLCKTRAISGDVTALLTFLHEKAARKWVSDTKDNPIAVSDMHGVEHDLNIEILDSHTYPIPRSIRRPIIEQGVTRVVQFSGLPSNLTCQAFTHLISESGTQYHGLVSIIRNEHDQFIAEFTGVVNAMNAVQRLLRPSAFPNALWGHLPDPCNGGVTAEQTGGVAKESEGDTLISEANEDQREEESRSNTMGAEAEESPGVPESQSVTIVPNA